MSMNKPKSSNIKSESYTEIPSSFEDHNEIVLGEPSIPNIREENEEQIQGNPRSILDLTFGQKLAIASGHFVNDITASIWFSYFLLYSEKVVGLSGNMAATLMLIGQIVDAISTPLVGYEADQGWGNQDYWLCRSGFGRYKSWHLFGVMLAVISFPFIFSPVLGYSGSNEIVKGIYYFPFIVIYEGSWAAVQISHLAMIPKMSPDILVRTEILSIRYILMVIANIIVFIVTWYSVGMGKHCVIDKTNVPTFQHLAFITMGIGLLTALFFYIATKEYDDDKVKEAVTEWERQQYKDSSQSSRDDESSPLLNHRQRNRHGLSTKYLNPGEDRMGVKDWIKLPQFYMVAAVYITGRLIINVPQAYLPLYLQESLHLPCSALATIPMTYFLAGLVVATIMKVMNKYIGRQLTFGFGISLNLCGAALMMHGDWSKGSFLRETGVFGVFALLGGGASAGMITGLSITADMIGNNVESGAFVYGFMSFCDKISCGIIIMIINLISPSIIPNQESKTVEAFYRDVIVYSCIGCSALAIVGLIALTLLIFFNNRKMNHVDRGRG